ncbi:MAG: hypothetical protein R3195_20085 [Gemmatimonadota bacterium]|nr:hypothetical protein [Gemmatimonadota bacterium]
MTRFWRSALARAALFAAGLALFTVAPELAAQAAEDGGEYEMSTLEGVYTEEQAARGEQLMWDICAECHFDEDYQGAFFEDWVGSSVWGLFDSIWSTMPEDNPGGLPLTDYADALAYIFRLNGIPAGDLELGTEQDQLEKILIEREP